MVDSHWICYDTGKPFEVNLDKFGFVYIITNTKSGKAYVGCKQYFLGKAKKKMKWETYMSSSKYLKADIKKIGKKHFTFEVIAEYKNKRSLRYYEAYYQMKWDVLTATMKDSDKPAFYNSYVGGKFYRPIESYTPHTEEAKKKMSEAKTGEKNPMYGKNFSEEHRKRIGEAKSKGKAEFYLNGKRMVVDCLGAWCNENSYHKGNVIKIAQTNRDGFYINKRKGARGLFDTYIKAFSCKGPLGTITKVRWLHG